MTKSLRLGALAIVLFLCANASFASAFLFADPYCNGNKPLIALQFGGFPDAPPYTVLRDEVIIGTSNSDQFDDTTGTPGKTYTYVVTSKNASGTVTRSSSRFAVMPLCNALPGPVVLTATEICNLTVTPPRAGVHLSWTAAANAGNGYYEVWRDNGTALLGSLIYGTSFDDLTPLTIGRTYDYAVYIMTPLNGVNGSNQAFATISSNACPPLPGAFTVSTSQACDVVPAVPTPAVTLTWSASSNAASYQILRDGAAYGASLTTSFKDSAAVAGHSYAYTVRAINNSGTIDSNTISVPVAASICLIPPLAFTVNSQTYCFLGDQPSTHVGWSTARLATSYTIYRNGVPLRLPFPAIASSMEDTEAEAGQTYTYTVRAANDYGTTDASTVVTVPAPICFPAAPASLAVDSACDRNAPVVHATWSPVPLAQVQLFRDGVAVSPVLPVGTWSFDDRSVITGKSYKYVVVASNRHGTAQSTVGNVSVAGDVCPVPPRTLVVSGQTICQTTAPAIRLDLDLPANFLGSLYRNGVPTLLAGNERTITDAAVLAGQSYTYFIRGTTQDAAYESNVIVVAVAACPTAPVVPPRHRGVRH